MNVLIKVGLLSMAISLAIKELGPRLHVPDHVFVVLLIVCLPTILTAVYLFGADQLDSNP